MLEGLLSIILIDQTRTFVFTCYVRNLMFIMFFFLMFLNLFFYSETPNTLGTASMCICWTCYNLNLQGRQVLCMCFSPLFINKAINLSECHIRATLRRRLLACVHFTVVALIHKPNNAHVYTTFMYAVSSHVIISTVPFKSMLSAFGKSDLSIILSSDTFCN